MIVLGIESSCDETAVALVTKDKCILSSVIASQVKAHAVFGGVVPELAARMHLNSITPITRQCLQEASISTDQIDYVAATIGPGLLKSLIVGSVFAKSFSIAIQKPFIGINHLEGHILVPRLSQNIPFPYLTLLASGGHTIIAAVHDIGKYQVYGESIDDSAGEAFDKVARLLGLSYPGGLEIENLALKAKKRSIILPRPMIHHKTLNFSFSGLKTATRTLIQKNNFPKEEIAYAFQKAICDVMVAKTNQAIQKFIKELSKKPTLVIAGGVARNHFIRNHLQKIALKHNIPFFAPPLNLCSDNACMIAWAAIERIQRNKYSSQQTKPIPRWPLQEMHE